MIVWEHYNRNYQAIFYGRLLEYQNSPQMDQGIMFGTQSKEFGQCKSIMCPPKLEMNRYLCHIHDNTSNAFFYADAVLLSESKQSVAFATSDCGATILWAENTGDIILAHTGRNQLMNIHYPTKRMSVLENCIKALLERGAKLEAIYSFSVGQIKAINFPHKGHPAESLVKKQAELWGKNIITDTNQVTLDLTRLIALQLMYYGVARGNIAESRIDPFSSPDLFSKRAGKKGSNVITLNRSK